MLTKFKFFFNIFNNTELQNENVYFPSDNDVFLVSFPKSGNTWARFVIGNYITNGNCDFKNSHKIVPDIHYNPKDIKLCKSPRIIKSHFQAPQPYKKVVYLLRDGRDVAVSYYFHQKKYRNIMSELSFNNYLNGFLNGDFSSFGTWSNHVNGWLNSDTDILLVKYEDLLMSPIDEFKKIIVFSGFDLDMDRLERSIKKSNFYSMQDLEKRQLSEVDLLFNSDTSLNFVRKGISGDWINYFDEELLQMFMEKSGGVLKKYGYINE